VVVPIFSETVVPRQIKSLLASETRNIDITIRSGSNSTYWPSSSAKLVMLDIKFPSGNGPVCCAMHTMTRRNSTNNPHSAPKFRGHYLAVRPIRESIHREGLAYTYGTTTVTNTTLTTAPPRTAVTDGSWLLRSVVNSV
jgi:hypothetical protein